MCQRVNRSLVTRLAMEVKRGIKHRGCFHYSHRSQWIDGRHIYFF